MENYFFERVLEFFRQKTVAVAVEILGEASPHRAGNSGRLSAECCWFMERLTRTSWAQAKQCCDWIDRNTGLRNSQTGWTLGVARNFCSSFGIALLRKESFLGGLLNSYPWKLTPNSSLLLDAKHSRLGLCWMTRSYLGQQQKSCPVLRFCCMNRFIKSQKDFHKLESAIGPGFCCDDSEASSQWG